MMNFKNTKMAKVISGFVGLSTAVMMMGPAVASAATVEELTAQINALLAQVAALQASSSSSSSSSVTTSGHMFSVDLTIGSKGADVVALQEILVAKGHLVMPAGVAMGYFGNLTKAAVAAWQAASGITPAAGYVGPKSRAALNGMGGSTTTTTTTTSSTGFPTGCTSAVGFSPITGASCATGSTVVVGGGVSVALDANSPSGTTIIAGATAKVASFKISNGTSAAAKVTMLKMKRTGVSSDSTLRNVYLYQGAKRLTDSASVATGNVNFSDSNGIVVVPAGGSVVVDVQIDIESGTNGQTVGMMLTEVTSDAGVVGGLPVSGAQHTVATAPSGMSVVDFNVTTTPTGGSVDPQSDYTMWQNVVNIGSRDALLSSIRFRQTGSVNSSDLKNFRLYVDGVQVGSAVDMIDSSNFVTFDFTASPLVLKAGGRTVKLVGDIVGGSSRSFSFSLQQSVDAAVWDSQLMVRVTPLSNSTTFSSRNTGTTNVNAGILTITKKTDSPSGNVVLQGSGVTLAKFDLKSQGEKLKVENLTVTFTGSSTATVRNVALFADGVQVGSTQNVVPAGTQFNLGSSLQVETGKTVVLEIRGDVFSTTGGQFIAGNTLTFNLTSGSGSNVYRTVSFGYQSYPASPVSGNQLTVAAGTMTLSKYTAYANQTVTVPQTAYKIGEYRLTSGNTEGVNLDTITLAINGPMTVTSLQDLYVVYGTKTSQIKSTGAASQTWSINEALPANSSMDVKVYATLNANATLSASTSLTMSGTSQSSGNAVTSGVVVGQDITVGTGTITSALDASTPVSANVVGNSMPKVASFKFTGSNDNFTITELWFTATSGAAAISELVVKDGATEVKRQALNGTVAQMTGLSVAVPYNSNKVLDVYVSVGGVGTGFATSSLNIAVALDAFKSRNSNGVEALDNTDRQGNAFYAFKTKPTITVVALPTTVLSAGTMTIAKFTVTADAGGTVSWKKIKFNVSTSTSAVSLATPVLYDAANESTALANVSAVLDQNAGTIVVTATADQEVSGSKTYVLKITTGGSITTGATVSTSIPSGVGSYSAPAANGVVAAGSTFDWSDESVLGHTLTTNDWYDNFLVKNIPTDSQTLTK